MSAPKKRITQATFDDAVKENMETFDLPHSEALTTTVSDFEAMGVDLSNIVKDGTSGAAAAAATADGAAADASTPAAPPAVHPVLQAVTVLRDFAGLHDEVEASLPAKVEEVVSALWSLAHLAQASSDNRAIAGSNLAVTYVLTALRRFLGSPSDFLARAGTDEASVSIRAALDCLRCLCSNAPPPAAAGAAAAAGVGGDDSSSSTSDATPAAASTGGSGTSTPAAAAAGTTSGGSMTPADENRSFVPLTICDVLVTLMGERVSPRTQLAAVDCAAVVVLKREEMKIRLFECKGLALGETGTGDGDEGSGRRRPVDDSTGKSALSAVASVGVTGAQGASAAVRRYLVLSQAIARKAKADAVAAAAAAAAPAPADAPAAGSAVAAGTAAVVPVASTADVSTDAPVASAASAAVADVPSTAATATTTTEPPAPPPPTASPSSLPSSSSSMAAVLPHLVRDGCILLYRLLTDDDLTAHASKAYNYARVLAGEGMLQLLLSALRQYTAEYTVAAEVLSALKAITVNDETCKEIDRLGGVADVVRALAPHVEAGSGAVKVVAAPTVASPAVVDAAATTAAAGAAAAASAASTSDAPADAVALARRHRMVKAGISLLRSVANSDSIKVRMCAGDQAPLRLLLQAAANYRDVPAVLEQAIACIGNLCLRLKDNAATVVAMGGIGLITAGMRANLPHAGVQRAGCLALRNIISRDADRTRTAFEEGAEALLQTAYIRHPACRDVAYACLRDLGCDYAETTIGRLAAERAMRALAAGDITVQ